MGQCVSTLRAGKAIKAASKGKQVKNDPIPTTDPAAPPTVPSSSVSSPSTNPPAQASSSSTPQAPAVHAPVPQVSHPEPQSPKAPVHPLPQVISQPSQPSPQAPTSSVTTPTIPVAPHSPFQIIHEVTSPIAVTTPSTPIPTTPIPTTPTPTTPVPVTPPAEPSSNNIGSDDADTQLNGRDKIVEGRKNQRMEEIFDKCDVDGTGFVEKGELKSFLEKMQIIDPTIHTFLLKRYDEDYDEVLNFQEFCEMLKDIVQAMKTFKNLDIDHNLAISKIEMASLPIVKQMDLSTHTLTLLMRLFDMNDSGAVDFEEFFPLVIYLNELLLQYNKFGERGVEDTKWLRPLLGSHPDEESEVAKELKRLKSDNNTPTIDEFVRPIVSAALSADAVFRQRVKAPLLTSKQVPRVRPPIKEVNVVPKSDKEPPQQLFNSTDARFSDQEFLPGDDKLPERARGKVVWQRIGDINSKASLFVNGVDDGDVIQGSLGDCWFLGALAALATTHSTQQLFVEHNIEKGYFCCKFFKTGKWIHVVVDDLLPCFPSGCLYFASCKDQSEFWVPIVEKAYAKLHGSYDAIEGGSISDALKDLTGGAVEILRLDAEQQQQQQQQQQEHDKQQQLDNIWEKLRYNIKGKYLMGCAIDRSGASPESKSEFGLLVNHAYSIIKCKEVNDIRLLRIRNPWGQGEWTGPWSDGAKEWKEYPELKGKLNYDFANDGTFFMRFEDFIQYFNRVYVLHTNESKKEKWESHSFVGEWKGSGAAGCLNFPNWLDNPQYGFKVTEPNTKFFVNLSQPDLRYTHKCNPSSMKSRYDPIGVYLLKTSSKDYKKMTYEEEDKVNRSQFTDIRDLSFDFTVKEPGEYVLLPCTFHPNVEKAYELNVSSNKPVTVQEITQVMPSKKCEGEWQGATAGGCINYVSTWMKNPQYFLVCSDFGEVDIILTQHSTPKDAEAITVYVFTIPESESGPTRRRIETPQKPHHKPKQIVSDTTIILKLTVDSGEGYIIMPTTFEPHVERKFTLTVAANEDIIQTFEPL